MQDSDRRPASNWCPILKFMNDFYVTDICTSDLCPFLQVPKSASNKSAIELRIWKGRRFENTLNSDRDLR
jgi:hypothetical protein